MKIRRQKNYSTYEEFQREELLGIQTFSSRVDELFEEMYTVELEESLFDKRGEVEINDLQ